MKHDSLNISQNGSVLEVILDRPPANAIDTKTSRSMGKVFESYRDNPNQRCAIISGSGTKFFSAGWDLKAAANGKTKANDDFGVGGFGGLQELPNLNKPVIAAVNGMAVGGGVELMLSADIIVVSEHSKFALPEIKAGTLADAATIKLPRRIPYHIAMDLLFTGRWLGAEEAKHWGLVNEIAPADQLMTRAREIAELLSNGPPLVYAAIKDVLRSTENVSEQEAFQLLHAKKVQALNVLYVSEDHDEGPRAFAEKRSPKWKGK